MSFFDLAPMKVAGVTIIRNAIRYDYPVVESIKSVLPLVDIMYVGLGQSEDQTRQLVQSIPSEKIVIVDTVWDDNLREGGKVLAVETNKVLDCVGDDFDWIVYIQGDEVLHESGIENIRKGMQQYLKDPRVEGLLLQYKHFYGHYRYIGDSRRWYRQEVRVVKNIKGLRSFRDAQGFRINQRLIRVKMMDAFVHHYGWVKNPKIQLEKDKSFQKLWHDDQTLQSRTIEASEYDYQNIDSLKIYTGTHPAVMHSRIESADWDFKYDTKIRRLSFKNRFLELLEKLTGYRFFEYKNFKRV